MKGWYGKMKAVMLIEKEDCVIECKEDHYILTNKDLDFGARIECDELEAIWNGGEDAYFSYQCGGMEVILRIAPTDAHTIMFENQDK